jgi:hypothetical protein
MKTVVETDRKVRVSDVQPGEDFRTHPGVHASRYTRINPDSAWLFNSTGLVLALNMKGVIEGFESDATVYVVGLEHS